MDQMTTIFHISGKEQIPVFSAAIQFPECRHVIIGTDGVINEMNFCCRELNRIGISAESYSIGAQTSAYNFPVILEKVKERFASCDSYGVNLTGGTKIMSFAAFYALTQDLNGKPDSVFAFYVDMDRKKFLSLAGNCPISDITVKMTVENFINISGNSICGKPSAPEVPYDLLEQCWNNRTLIQRYQGKFAEFTDGKRQSDKDAYLEFRRTIGQSEFINLREQLNESNWKKEAAFFAGGWFEQYVCACVQRADTSDTISEIYCNLQISIPDGNESGNANTVQQEFDICYTDGFKFIILECKAGFVKQEYFQKLENLSNRFSGAIGQAAIVSCNSLSQKSSIIRRVQYSRNIAAFSGKECCNCLCSNIWNLNPKMNNRAKIAE